MTSLNVASALWRDFSSVEASSLIRHSSFVIRLPRRSSAKAGRSHHVCIGR